MTCDGVRELLPLYAGRDLDDAQIAQLQSHVDGCEACARELEGYRECTAVLQELRNPAIPDVSRDMWENVRRGVFGTRPKPQRTPAVFAFFKCAAVVLIGVCVGFTAAMLLTNRVDRPAPQPKIEMSAPAPTQPPIVTPAAPAGGRPKYYYPSSDYRKELRELRKNVEELQKRLAELEKQKEK